MSRTGIVTRDDTGLMPAQREYLEEFSKTGSEAEARESLNLSNQRVARWHREEEAFRTAFGELVEGVHEATIQRLKQVEEELPDHIQRLLAAQKPIKVDFKCYDCGKKNTQYVHVDNPVVQARMVELLMKAQGHHIDRRHLTGDIAISEGLSHGLRMALALHNSGKSISAQSRLELLNMGLIEDTEPAIEGVSRELGPGE